MARGPGARVANTDRGPYNILLFTVEGIFTFAPAFNRAPKQYAPAPDGQIHSNALVRTSQRAESVDISDEAGAPAA